MDKRTSVTVIGDNPDIADSLVSDLKVLGLNTSKRSYREIDMTDIIQNPPDIILLDLTVCDFNTLSICELLSRNGNLPATTALVALVSENSMGQIPLDYNFAEIIMHPYEISEMSFRLRRVIHLYQQETDEDTFHIGNLTISPSRYEIKVNGQPVTFSHKEYELFKHLVTHPSHVFTREELFVTIWGNNHLGESRTVDVHIRRIRAKIGDIDQTYIKTVRGVGYAFSFESN